MEAPIAYEFKSIHKKLDRLLEQREPHPDCVEYILEDGTRWAWSESNTQYERVSPDTESFWMMRQRLLDAEAKLKAYEELATTGDIDRDRYHNDPIYHAVVYMWRRGSIGPTDRA